MSEVKRPPRSQGRWAYGWRKDADAYMDQQDARIAELEAQAARHEAELREVRRKALEEARDAECRWCSGGHGFDSQTTIHRVDGGLSIEYPSCGAVRIRAIIEKEHAIAAVKARREAKRW